MIAESVPKTAPVDGVEDLARIAAPILRRHRTITASVFGSMARGDAGPDSDVDLLVEFERGVTLFDLADLKLELEEALGRKVDLTSPGVLKPRLRGHVMKHVVKVL